MTTPSPRKSGVLISKIFFSSELRNVPLYFKYNEGIEMNKPGV